LSNEHNNKHHKVTETEKDQRGTPEKETWRKIHSEKQVSNTAAKMGVTT